MIKKLKVKNKNLINNLIEIFKDNLISVVLFGSRARKNYNEYSDIDLMIIVNEYKNEDISKLTKEYLINFQNKLDIHIFSAEDIIKNFNNFSPLFVTLLLGKKIIFDRKMFFENSFSKFIEKIINQNIKYCEGGKIWEMKEIAQNLNNLQ